MQSEKVKFARRHLYRVAAVGAAALLAKTVLPKPAKAVTCTTASAVSASNPEGLNPTAAGDPDCITFGDVPNPSGSSNGSNGRCFLRGTQISPPRGRA